jgi:uncharacterized membrane protein YcjF (UPF0283 family)
MKKPAINKQEITKKAKAAWTALTENEIEVKFTITPLGVIAVAAGVGASVCAIRALHKLEIKNALKKQALAIEQALAQADADADAIAPAEEEEAPAEEATEA